MFVIATVGAFTAFMAATIALTQNDIKRVVAYSTVSQLGYMAFALGTGAWVSAIFHLMTHAFFKGLLFLGCGTVIHGMHEEQNIQKMGGLRKYMPITFWTFLIGVAGQRRHRARSPASGPRTRSSSAPGPAPIFPSWGKVVAIVGLVAAFMTAFYMFRLVFLTFFGKPRFDTAHVHPHESPPAMTMPLVLLAIPSVVIGFVGFPPDDGRIHHFLEPVFGGRREEATRRTATRSPRSTSSRRRRDESTEERGRRRTRATAAEVRSARRGSEHAHVISNAPSGPSAIISTVVALAGILVAYLTYITGAINPVAVAARFRGLYRFLYNKWCFDELYDRIFVQPLEAAGDVPLARGRRRHHRRDGERHGRPASTAISQRLRHVQTGLVANYALAIALGMVVIVGVYLAAFSDLFR